MLSDFFVRAIAASSSNRNLNLELSFPRLNRTQVAA